ncbi:MAG: anhydro-N-acetylmuramic acid kinase [Rhodospirillales bacterium]
MAPNSNMLNAIGLMSGTSMDGIDAAFLRTDGKTIEEFGPSLSLSYENEFRDRLRGALRSDSSDPRLADIERDLTNLHARIIEQLLVKNKLTPDAVDLIGFHGHTLDHRPDEGITLQIGNGEQLASETGIPVVNNFRSNDVASGGEGAPFAPLYHRALAHLLDKPLAVLNIGGVANVTWIGPDDKILAFDTGPGNALIDDWVFQTQDQSMDLDGKIARTGTIDNDILAQLLDHPYFLKRPPKSLDRGDFNMDVISALKPSDGAATLSAFTVKTIAKAQDYFPMPVKYWLVCGGGRKNPFLMQMLADELGVPVEPVEDVRWNGDELEAQAFAFLGVRSLAGLPLSLPTTTAVMKPTTGGTLHLPPDYTGELGR